ncbi:MULTISPECIES: hypothetical protein [unclassified Eikenella]|uniref:hypothetical protein n=1 Tax=unclassified Eikenella TaxID=2639367 RepID=UPI000F62F2ED|nr:MULTISPECIES: hypothetical protein [unclassified Eikenella]
MWYELRASGKLTHSYGWSLSSDTGKPGHLNKYDNENYIEDKNHPVTSFTIEISKEQYDGLTNFPDRAQNGEIKGFYTRYNILYNSCIDFVAKALVDIGFASAEF